MPQTHINLLFHFLQANQNQRQRPEISLERLAQESVYSTTFCTGFLLDAGDSAVIK